MRSGENLYEYRKSTMHLEKIGVWCGMSRKRIVAPIFFTSTITGDVYHDIIQQFVSQLEKSERRSPLNILLWGYLKNCVYMTAFRNLEELKGNIAQEIENIDQKTLKHVFLNLMKRCGICTANSGGQLQHLL